MSWKKAAMEDNTKQCQKLTKMNMRFYLGTWRYEINCANVFQFYLPKNNVWKLKRRSIKNSRNWNNSLPDSKNNRHRGDRGGGGHGASVLRQI